MRCLIVWKQAGFVFAFAVALMFPAGLQAICQEGGSEPVLVRVYSSASDSRVGTWVSEDTGQITINDLKTGNDVSVNKTADLKILKPIGLDDAARVAGLSKVVGWKLSQMAGQEKPTGKVARITAQVVYVSLGEDSKIRVGQSLEVFRNDGEIVDPDSGQVLGSERSRIAQLEVVEVQAKFSKAKLVGDLEVNLEVGDEVEPTSHGLIVGICPVLNDDGSLTTVGAGITEDLTTILVQKKVSVVERSVMAMVLSELLVQNTILFDEASAQKIGKLTGANVVLTGKIVAKKTSGIAYVRLINVETGDILFAISAPVNLSSATEIQGSNSPSRSSASSGSIGKSGGAKSAKFGRQLPNFLATRARYERVGDEGIRIQGHEGFNYSDMNSIGTKDSDFLDHDFTFEIKFAFGPEEHFAYFGLGMGQADQSYNGITDSVYLRFSAPNSNAGKGDVQVHGFKLNQDDLGKVTIDATHSVRIIKEGTAVTFYVDPGSDGPSDDDLEMTIPDIGKYAHFFNSKNVHIFFGGAGIFKEVSLLKGKAVYPKSEEPKKENPEETDPETGLDAFGSPAVVDSSNIAPDDGADLSDSDIEVAPASAEIEASPSTPEITIVSAVFGSGKAAISITEKVQEIIKNHEAVTHISGAPTGLAVKNPRGYFRDLLRISYLVDGRAGQLEFKNGMKVNIFKAIIEKDAQQSAEPQKTDDGKD